MKHKKKLPPKESKDKGVRSSAKKRSSESSAHKGVDKQQLSFEIETGIYEVDKIFEGQGDRLNDSYVIESLTTFVKVIKENTFGGYAETLKEGSDEESDMMHINIVNRISSAAEELEIEFSDSEVIETVKSILAHVKKASSPKSPRAYLDPLSKRLKEMGFKSDFITDSDIDSETIRLEDIENLDDLNLDDDDDLDLDNFRPGY